MTQAIQFKLLLFLLLGMISVAAITGCNRDKPKNLIDEETYVDVMVELQLIRTFQNTRPGGINTDSLKQIIFDKYGVEEEQFLSSHQYYQQQVSSHITRTDRAIQKLETERQQIRNIIDSLSRDTTRAAAEADTLQQP